MAGFKTHVGVSTGVGIGYATAGHLFLDISPPTAIVSAGLCAIAGMLPDVDSDSGKPVQEVMGFAAAVIPLLLAEQMRRFGLERDALVAAAVCVYVLIRFGIGELLRRVTVHRGMWHSLPAVAMAAMITMLLCWQDKPLDCWFKVGAVSLGYLVHLALDEIYSIEWYRGRLRLKSSSGTAMKIWGQSLGANLFTFAGLAALAYVLLNPQFIGTRIGDEQDPLQSFPREANHQTLESEPSWLDRR